MKLLTSISLLAIVALSGCEKKEKTLVCEYTEVVRLRTDCDRIIFKVLSNNFTGDATWTDVSNGKQHSNVIAMINPCRFFSIPYPVWQRRDTFYVKIKQLPNNNPPIPGEDCAQCLAISNNPPKTQVDFTEIQLSPCEF